MKTRKMKARRSRIAGMAFLSVAEILPIASFAGESPPGAKCDLLHDTFSSANATAKLWYMPTFTSSTDGTYIGRTQFEIRWLPGSVDWYVDGNRVREVTSGIPTGPVQAYMNIWAPDSSWTQAFNANIQPSSTSATNVVLNWLVADSICISSL